MRQRGVGTIVLLATLALAAAAWAQGPLKVGDKAPEFPHPLPSTAADKPGAAQVQLADFLGKKNIVLAFYVADWRRKRCAVRRLLDFPGTHL